MKKNQDPQNSPAYDAKEVVANLAPGFRPHIAVILGSGLGPLADDLEDTITIPYAELPGFYPSTVVGHKGTLVLGYRHGVPIACMTGRSHIYEGLNPASLAAPIRTLKLIGAEILLVTNASGSLRPGLPPGSLVAINDHLNFQGTNPLIGPNDDSFGPRFFGLHDAYDRRLSKELHNAASDVGATLHDGVYLALTGPSFETKAEINAFRTLGADIVGMSTVPEIIVARHCGLRVAAVSVVTNFAAEGELSHDLTLATSHRAMGMLKPMIERWFELVGVSEGILS